MLIRIIASIPYIPLTLYPHGAHNSDLGLKPIPGTNYNKTLLLDFSKVSPSYAPQTGPTQDSQCLRQQDKYSVPSLKVSRPRLLQSSSSVLSTPLHYLFQTRGREGGRVVEAIKHTETGPFNYQVPEVTTLIGLMAGPAVPSRPHPVLFWV